MNKNLVIGLVVIILILGGIWIFMGKGDQPADQAPVTTNTEPAAVAARQDLAGKLAMSTNDVVISKVEATTWSDGCLGLGGPAESCIQMLIEGYRVEMQVAGKTYVYRTDKTGATLRAEASINN